MNCIGIEHERLGFEPNSSLKDSRMLMSLQALLDDLEYDLQAFASFLAKLESLGRLTRKDAFRRVLSNCTS